MIYMFDFVILYGVIEIDLNYIHVHSDIFIYRLYMLHAQSAFTYYMLKALYISINKA